MTAEKVRHKYRDLIMRCAQCGTCASACPSSEVSDFPVFSPGLRPPEYVDDLEVTRLGDDLVLDWSEVVLDVVGKTEQVTVYEILRGTGTDFRN